MTDSGTLGNGRFQLIRQLGVGGMGVVYEAEDRERGGRLALKTLRNASADTLYRLKSEFRALADLQHPNLVALHELFVADDSFFTMDLVIGTDFLTYVRPATPHVADASGRPESARGVETLGFDEGRLRSTLPQLSRAVLALHEAGKIHRDIKPSNVIVTDEGRLVLVDFGLVTQTGSHNAESRVGQVVGTVAYMAPEQARGDDGISAAADWYAVGAALYEALTGRVPFDGPAMRVLVEKQQRAPAPPRAISPAVPKDLDELCAALLERDPRDRP